MKRQMNRKAVIGTVLAALVAAGAVGAHFCAKSAPMTGPLTLSCVPGAEATYSVAYTSHGSLSDSTLGIAPAQPGDKAFRVDATVDGRMHATCVASAKDEQTLAVTFDGIAGSLDLHGGEGGGEAAELLRGTTMVTRDSRGHTRRVQFDPQMPEGGRTLVRDLLALGQITFATPSLPTQASWQSREEDMNGSYTAGYEITGESGKVAAIKKTRVATESKLRSEAMKPHAEAREGTGGAFEFDRAEGRVVSADVKTSMVLTVSRREVGTTEGTLSLRLRESSAVAPEALAALQASAAFAETTGAGSGVNGVASGLGARDVDAKLEAQIQRKELGKETWKSLSARLDDKAGHGTKLYLQLKALFLLEPATCAEAGRALAQMDPNSPQFSVLSGALTAAGNAQSQRALLDVASGAEDNLPLQRAVVAAMGFEKAPDASTFDGLKRLSTDSKNTETQSTARLALGSLARAGEESDPTDARGVITSELDAARRARTPQDKILALLALGNTGSPDAMAVVRDALADPEPRVRTAAASALRFIEVSGAESLLVSLVSQDPEPGVRSEAIHSLSFRVFGSQAAEVVGHAAEADVDEKVRMAAVQVIGGEVVGDPALIAVLERVAAHDSTAGVRNAAEIALVRYRATKAG